MSDKNERAGTVSTTRHAVVRWRYGLESGDLFCEDSDYDGLTLTIECANWRDAETMLAAIEDGDTT